MEKEYIKDLIKSSDEFNKTYDKIDFVINATTKEQYLAFKKYIKDYLEKYDSVDHHIYVAYYMFKHRIGCDFENGELIDNMKLREFLDNEIIKCYKMLYHGENSWIYGGGGDCMKYEAIPKFKRKTIDIYNKFATGNYKIEDDKVIV